MNIEEMPYLLKVGEVADILKCSIITIKRKAKRKQIRSVRINSRGDFRFFRQDIESILARIKKYDR